MSYYIVIRESSDQDRPFISEVVLNAYSSNIKNTWLNALFNEVTYQTMVLVFALLFICFGVPLFYCFSSIPLVLLSLYVIIYATVLMKATQVMHEKKPLMCWVAEAYEPYFFMKNPENCWYKIITEDDTEASEIRKEGYQRKIIGTIAVMRHLQRDDWAWLFRLAVDHRYHRKGIGLKLIQMVQNWCKTNQFNNIELVMSECQEGSRDLFDVAGFHIKQLYHKKLFTSAVTLQMFQLRCEVRSTF
ncbi:unnamed protein product [Phaedon cochleariae]|uniref:N-acetyltransferase domain-containing protein n=1 Tax=Phaedon cochleariae TaxID=80249 RepID=A0A9P0DSS6_PHACE|nr:unnamed protein product [Phaedon cochleariae]